MNKIKQIVLVLAFIWLFVFVADVTYNFVEPKSYDFMTRSFLVNKLPFDKYKKVHGSDDIVLVVIDSKSIEKHRWPWKRELYGDVFEFLNYSKSKIIIHDAIITSLDKDNPASDKKYFDTIRKYNNLIVGFMISFDKPKDEISVKKFDEKFAKKFSLNVEDKTTKTPDFYNSIISFPEPYYNSVKNVGSVAMIPGFINGNISRKVIDHVYRNHEFIFAYKGNFYPSFALKTYLMLNKNPKIFLTDKSIKFENSKFEIKQNRTYYQMFVPVRFYKLYKNSFSHLTYSASDVLDSYEAIKQGRKPKINPEVFRDKIVVVGAYAPASAGLNDSKNTPITVNHPGVDYQATVIDNIIHNDFLKILPLWVNTLITVLGMLLVYGFIRVSNLLKSILSSFTIVISYLCLTAICFYFGIVINVITPIVMFVLTTILAYTHKFVLENRSKEKVKSAMGKYMSQDVMKKVIQDIDNLGLGGKRANVTVLFSDIRGFTSMSEQMTPQQVSEILNEYFTEMEPIITKYNGVINKFIGDAVMAIFGEPIQDKNHAQNAVKCAYSMLEKVKELQKKWAQEGKPKIEIGVGISTGEVFVGNIGSVNRMEYTVIGDTVNLASRLEGYNKTYKTKLLISPNTYEEVKSIVDVIKISDVQIRGKVNKMNIYEVLKVDI